MDSISDFLAYRKGLLPIIGMVLILVNFIIKLIMINFITETDLFLHAGVIIAILGFLIAWAL